MDRRSHSGTESGPTGRSSRPFPEADAEGLPEHPPCPFCDSDNTRLISPFGGQMSVAQYWCDGCRTAFEFMKWG